MNCRSESKFVAAVKSETHSRQKRQSLTKYTTSKIGQFITKDILGGHITHGESEIEVQRAFAGSKFLHLSCDQENPNPLVSR